jgi:putative DNA primase/helicase
MYEFPLTEVSESWPEVLPLPSWTPEPLPRECVPNWIGDMAEAVAESTVTPFELAAVLAIGVVSACVAGRAEVIVEPAIQNR